MEDLETILKIANILTIVFAILEIILFFKIWGMTNNVKAVRALLEERLSVPVQDNSAVVGDFEIGALVVEISTGKQMRIKEITKEGKYSCYTGNYTNFCGDFTSNQIESFKDYSSKLKK